MFEKLPIYAVKQEKEKLESLRALFILLYSFEIWQRRNIFSLANSSKVKKKRVINVRCLQFR